MIYKRKIFKLFVVLVFCIFFSFSVLGKEIDSLDKDVLVEKAKVQFLLKNYEGALHIAEKVLKDDPNNIDALIICSQINYINKRFEKAKEYFERIFAVEPMKRGIFLRDYGIVLKSLGDYLGARRCIEEYISENPEDSLAKYHLGEVFYVLGESEKAEIELKTVYNKRDDQMVLAAILCYFFSFTETMCILLIR